MKCNEGHNMWIKTYAVLQIRGNLTILVKGNEVLETLWSAA
jgi:hypothetical protein